MTGQQRRPDELAALAAILALGDVAEYEWLRAGRADGVRTPDLRLVLGDGREVAAEITMATNRPANELRGAARKKMWPIRIHELSYEWTVHVSDHHIAARDAQRTLKELVAAMTPVLAGVEQRGGTAQEMQVRADRILDPDRHDPYVSQSMPWVAAYQAALPWYGSLQDWARAHLAQHCDYWYPPDIVDRVVDGLEPRRVSVLKPPVPAQHSIGGVYVHAAAMEPGFRVEDVGYLVPALQTAINHKHAHGQMSSAAGARWLVVPIDGGNAATQLEACFGPEAPSPSPDLSEAVDLLSFDEVWALAKAFHGRRYVVLRLFNSGDECRGCTIDMP